jgi:hypothetical protein
MQRVGSKVVVAGALLALATASVARAADGAAGDGRTGSYVLVGGGVTGFTDSTAKDLWDTGWTWDARLGAGNRSFLGGELAYVGALHPAKTGSLDLLANGAEAVLRLQLPYAMNGWLVEPFAFGGVGWSYLSLRNAPSGAKSTDNIGDVPFGAGVTFGVNRLLIDARFTYRATFNEDLVGPAGTVKMRSWAVNAAIGLEF